MARIHIIENDGKEPITLWLEPWAEQFDIPASSTLKLVCECPDEVDCQPSVEGIAPLLTYSFGSGCPVRLWLNEDEVTYASGDVPSP